jgi:plasmid stabilization system protein ParE
LRYRLSPEATSQLTEILRRIAADNILAARRFDKRIRKTFGTLAHMPDIGTRTQSSGTLAFVFRENYRIVYRKLTAAILIASVVHVARASDPRGPPRLTRSSR